MQIGRVDLLMMHFIASESSVCFPYPKKDFFFSSPNEFDVLPSPVALNNKIPQEVTVF